MSIPLLNSGEVHIWFCSYKLSEKTKIQLYNLLTIEEERKASNFIFEKDQETTKVSRGLLRYLLSSYLNIDSSKIMFYEGKYGKPDYKIIEHNNKPKIHFNLSHSAGLIMIGFSLDYDIGVDLELYRKDYDFYPIVNEFFTMNEISYFITGENDEKSHRFFYLWTRKEAYMKNIGDGLNIPLNSFHVLNDKIANKDNKQYYIKSIPLRLDNYCAAFCLTGMPIVERYMTFINM